MPEEQPIVVPTKSKTGWVIGAVLIAAAGVAGWWFANSTEETASVADVPVELSFAQVVRTDLIETESLDGTLGRSGGDNIITRSSGTVTGTVEAGTIVAQGDVLFSVDEEPAVLLLGDVPAWRTMGDDTEGVDVLQLETALVTLGYDPDETVTVDEEFTWYTEQMVERWQEETGAEVDGVVDLGEVIFLPESVRIADVPVAVGSPVQNGSPVLATSSANTVITVDLDAADQGLLEAGMAVTVILPDGTETPATVESVSTVATTDQSGQSTFEVIITLDDPSAAAGLDEAPIEIEFVSDSRTGVLAVPVTALLALSEGGYAVEVESAGGTTLVAVEPGFFADGLVEVTGDLDAADRVVVP